MTETAEKPVYRVPFVERTGLRTLEEGRGHCKLVMPLAGNENHVEVMYLGAFAVLAEAAAAKPGISILDTARFFPIVKDLALDFKRMAASDLTAEYALSDEQQAALLADLERKGSATYTAEFPLLDDGGAEAASARVTIKLLSHDWPAQA